MSSETGTVAVTQDDRNFAGQIGSLLGYPFPSVYIRDHPEMVQLVARHRLSSTPPPAGDRVREAADGDDVRAWMRQNGCTSISLIEDVDVHLSALSTPPAPVVPEGLREALEKVKAGYVSQMKFCDIEALGYFREFVRRIDEALSTPAPAAPVDLWKALDDLIDIAVRYADFVRTDVRADDLERHPYLPAIDQAVADGVQTLALLTPSNTTPVDHDAGERR